MLTISSAVSGSKLAIILVSLIAIVTAVDSQFIRVFYPTQLGTPGNFQFLLFVSFVLFAFIVNTVLILFAKSNDTQARSSRPLLFRTAYISTIVVQITISLVMFLAISEMLIFQAYSKILSLIVIYLSHFLSATILGILAVVFLQWFRYIRSLSILLYASVFIAIVILILITLPLLTEQFKLQPQDIYPRTYISLILDVLSPSPDIAFVYELGTFVLPIMAIASWMLTASLLKGQISRIGKKKFWLVVSIPLAYQIFVLIVSNPDLVTGAGLIQFVYSPQIQLLVAINGQISGLFFAVAYWTFARKMGQKSMKNFFIISSIGVISLFSSIQPGSPFYAAYPPFGLATLLFLGLSSYLLLVGMIGSAAYVSRDSVVRREVYNGLQVDPHVLRMGMAEMQREIERRVLNVAEKIKSSELADEMKNASDPDEQDVRLMVEEILKEVHSKDRSHQ